METLTKIILASIKEIRAIPEEPIMDYKLEQQTVGPLKFPYHDSN